MSKPSMTSWADAATISKADTRLDIGVIGERKRLHAKVKLTALLGSDASRNPAAHRFQDRFSTCRNASAGRGESRGETRLYHGHGLI